MFQTGARVTLARALFLLAIVSLSQAQSKSRITGVITDSMCATGAHSGMRMGANDAECTVACVEAHGAMYVLYDGKSAWTLSDQRTPEKLAGKKVVVTGVPNEKTKTIQVESIAIAK
jgi:hypothetical protein